jgi:hypothetical protein
LFTAADCLFFDSLEIGLISYVRRSIRPGPKFADDRKAGIDWKAERYHTYSRRLGMNRYKNIMVITLMCTAVMFLGLAHAATDGRNAAQMDTAPGPAFTTVDGKVTKIEGSVYTIESESTGYQNYGSTTNVSEMKIFVGQQTKKLHGEKKVGDKVRAEITRGGFANSLQ